MCAGWDRLVGEMAFPNVFLTREWVACWWKWFGAGNELRLGVAWRGDEVVGIAPFYRGRMPVLRALQVPAVRLLGDGDRVYPDFLGPIVGREDGDALVELIAANWGRIVREDREVALFSDVLTASAPMRHLVEALARSRKVRRLGEGVRCPYADLPRSYEEFLAGLGARQREGIRRRKRKAERAFRLGLECVNTVAAVDRAFDVVAEVYADSERGRNSRACFADAVYAGFHRDLAKRVAQRGWLRLHLLTFDAKPVAFLYGYQFGERFWFYQTGYAAACREYGPGSLLMQFVIERAIAEGAVTLEFLRGEEGYKYHFAGGERKTETVALLPSAAMTSSLVRFEDLLRRVQRDLARTGR